MRKESSLFKPLSEIQDLRNSRCQTQTTMYPLMTLPVACPKEIQHMQMASFKHNRQSRSHNFKHA